MPVATMAKAKKQSRPETRAGSDARRVIASFKGSDEFDEWVVELARFLRLSKSTAIEHGLVELAKARGFETPPPER